MHRDLSTSRYRILLLARVLAVIPVILGAFVYSRWTITHDDRWLAIGWWVLLIIVASVLINIIIICIYFLIWKREITNPSIVWTVIFVIISIFLACLGLKRTNVSLIQVEVMIDNQSQIPISDITISDSIHTVSFGDVAANSKFVLYFLPMAESPLYASFIVEGRKLNVLVSGYISIDGGSNATIIVSPSRDVSVLPTTKNY